MAYQYKFVDILARGLENAANRAERAEAARVQQQQFQRDMDMRRDEMRATEKFRRRAEEQANRQYQLDLRKESREKAADEYQKIKDETTLWERGVLADEEANQARLERENRLEIARIQAGSRSSASGRAGSLTSEMLMSLPSDQLDALEEAELSVIMTPADQRMVFGVDSESLAQAYQNLAIIHSAKKSLGYKIINASPSAPQAAPQDQTETPAPATPEDYYGNLPTTDASFFDYDPQNVYVSGRDRAAQILGGSPVDRIRNAAASRLSREDALFFPGRRR